MNEMVLRVAGAICGCKSATEECLANHCEVMERKAREVMAAIRVPTEAMIKTGEMVSYRAVEVWRDMIDEATGKLDEEFRVHMASLKEPK